MTPTPRWFVHEYARYHWHVCDSENHNTPIYDDAPYGNDKPVIYTDYDLACEVRDALNAESPE